MIYRTSRNLSKAISFVFFFCRFYTNFYIRIIQIEISKYSKWIFLTGSVEITPIHLVLKSVRHEIAHSARCVKKKWIVYSKIIPMNDQVSAKSNYRAEFRGGVQWQFDRAIVTFTPVLASRVRYFFSLPLRPSACRVFVAFPYKRHPSRRAVSY